MGLLKATFTAVSSTLADQYKEYFSMDAFPSDVLVARGIKSSGGKNSNKGSDDVISDGSGIAVADGQCAVIVEQGKIVELCAETGIFTYSNKTSPSIFTGSLQDSIKASFQTMGARITMGGGSAGSNQRVYYFNVKEIVENRYGTATPIPFRVVGRNHSFDLDTSVKCNGQYSYKIIDPILFYTNVCGNVTTAYRRSELDSTLKSELLTALQPALGRLSAQGIRYSDLPSHAIEIADALNQILSKSWQETRGLKIVSFGINSISIPQEDAQQIRQLQLNETPNLAAANLAAAQADGIRNASSNAAGSLHGFMGMNMVNGMGGMNPATLFQTGQPPVSAPPLSPVTGGWHCDCGTMNSGKFCSGCGKPETVAGGWRCDCGTTNSGKFCSGCGKPETVAGGWCCDCGTTNSGKFCSDCGKPEKKAEPKGWNCGCGEVNLGNFCQGCGKAKPKDAPLYRCDKCGFNPPNPKRPPRFCPICGDVFDSNDAI